MSITTFGPALAYGLGVCLVRCTLRLKVSVTLFGPALAYGLGGVFSQMYVTLEGECNYI